MRALSAACLLTCAPIEAPSQSPERASAVAAPVEVVAARPWSPSPEATSVEAPAPTPTGGTSTPAPSLAEPTAQKPIPAKGISNSQGGLRIPDGDGGIQSDSQIGTFGVEYAEPAVLAGTA